MNKKISLKNILKALLLLGGTAGYFFVTLIFIVSSAECGLQQTPAPQKTLYVYQLLFLAFPIVLSVATTFLFTKKEKRSLARFLLILTVVIIAYTLAFPFIKQALCFLAEGIIPKILCGLSTPALCQPYF